MNSLKLDKKTNQDLSAGALSYTTSYGRAFKLEQILIKVSQSITETVTITHMSVDGTNYNAILQAVDLVSESSLVYRPQGEMNFQAGDEIKVQCTNSNLVGIVYVKIKTREVLL